VTCDDMRKDLDLYLDGGLDDAARAAADAHLSACEVCREEAEALRSVVGLVREIPRPRAPDGFADGVLAKLPRAARPRSVLRFVAPLAAAACLLVALRLAFPPAGDGPPPTEVARSPELEDGLLRKAAEKEARPYEEAVEAEGAAARPAGDLPVAVRSIVDPSQPADRAQRDDGPRNDKPRYDRPPARPEPRADRKYLVAGKAPDATAGLILAELDHHREVCRDSRWRDPVSGRAGDRAPIERVEADAAGEPSYVLLSLTHAEEEYLVGLLDRETGLRLSRTNGYKEAPMPPAGPPPPEAIPAEPDPDEVAKDDTGEGEDESAPEVAGPLPIGGGVGAAKPAGKPREAAAEGKPRSAAEEGERAKARETRRPVLFRFAR